MTASTHLPSPPFIDVAGIANFRDMGGYATQPSGSIRRGLLYRSANPNNVLPAGLETMHKLGITKVFDLRSEPEVLKGSVAEGRDSDRAPDIRSPFNTRRDDPEQMSGGQNLGSGPSDHNDTNMDSTQIERVWTPVFRTTDYTGISAAVRWRVHAESRNEAGAVASGYREILDQAGPAYKIILAYLASSNPRPCLFHCTAGKDRTGALAAVIYLLCGVDRTTIAREYALTTQGLGPLLAEFKERYMKMFHDMPDKERVLDIMLGCKEESMLGVIDMLDKEYGGAEGYVRHTLSLDDDTIAAIRRNMVTQERAVL